MAAIQPKHLALMLLGACVLLSQAACRNGEPASGQEPAGSSLAAAPAGGSPAEPTTSPGETPAASGQTPAMPGDSLATTASETSGAAPAPVTPGNAEGPNYTLTVPALELAPGVPGTLQLEVVGHSGFHINVEYPWRLRLEPPAGLSIANLEWTSAEAAVLTTDQVRFEIPVEAGAPGQYLVAGQLRFSVCSNARCDLPMVDLGWSVTVASE